MTQFNHQGFVVRQPDGRLLADSHLSAYSHRRAVTNSLLEPVAAVPGLYVRATARELAQRSEAARNHLHANASAWYIQRFGLPPGVPNGTAEEHAVAPDEAALTLDDLTLDELLVRARDLGIPGRSKMDKAALFEAIQRASGVPFGTPDEGDANG